MLNHIILWSLENRLVVLVLTLLLIAVGIHSFHHLPIDAFPDTTPVQVQINTVAPALSSSEIEQQITIPLEQSLNSLPKITELRSLSKFGLSQVVAVFEDGTDIYFARQVVMENLSSASLPQNISPPRLGPVATGLGEVYHYILTSRGKTLEELTTLHNWVIKPRLKALPGVAEVNTWGGCNKQYHILIHPEKLIKYHFTMDSILSALQKSNLNVGGGYLEQSGGMEILQGIGIAVTLEDIKNIVVGAYKGVPVRMKDLGQVEIGHEIRTGAVTAGGEGEVVLGLGFMRMGENSRNVSMILDEKMKEIQKNLPSDVQVHTVYNRTTLIDQVMGIVEKNLLEGAVLVVSILFIFLGNLRAGIIVALAIPLSMLFAFTVMAKVGIAGSLMSLGAIDFGLIVDSSVIMVENAESRLAGNLTKRPILEVIKAAALEVRKPTMFGELIIMIVFLPILALEGVEGKLFKPMALTVIFALSASLILSLTLMPVLASLFLPRKSQKQESLSSRFLKGIYRPVLRMTMKIPILIFFLIFSLLAWGCWCASRLGSEFIPRLSEMSIIINTVRLSGISLKESVRYGTQIEKLILKKYPDEVKDIWTRTGTAEVATDPMGIEVSDVFITLHPREKWKKAKTQNELSALIRRDLEGMPGMRAVLSQPIEMRMNEMIGGIRADVGVKIFGDDLKVLKEKAKEVEKILKSMKGGVDVYAEQITGLPILEIRLHKERLSRYGIPPRHVLEMIEAVAGIKVGEIREGQRRFDLVVKLSPEYRKDEESLQKIFITTADGKHLPLSQLAKMQYVEGPTTINREWQKRRIVVQCNVQGRDAGGFVAELMGKISSKISFPEGYHIEYGGQFEHLQRAKMRLMFVVPLALFLVFFLLYMSTKSWIDSWIIFTGAPFATLGGITALWWNQMPFTISAAIGFIALCGVSMLNGLVMISTIQNFIQRGKNLAEAVELGALERIRPVLMTALVGALGFIPMALNTGVGAEVQKPLAIVVIGGVISDTLLTLLVLPVLYRIFGKRK